MNKTSIEWTDYTWNPVTGCTKVSAGCKNCYAERMANRFKKSHGDFRTVTLHPERLAQPITKKVPAGSRVFVCDVSDLFHKDVPFDFIHKVFLRMDICRHITFQILTKRPERALEFSHAIKTFLPTISWPLPNVWIGTSCENQETANERIPKLIQIEATKLFLSCEPLLGPIDFGQMPKMRIYGKTLSLKMIHCIDWIIAGGESGPRARPMNPDWVRSIRDQCKSAHIPFFFKQWGEWIPDSHISFNGPFLIQDAKHCVVDRQGNSWPWIDPFSSVEDMCRLTKEDDAWWMAKVGKSKSGNVLDGKQHLAFPA